MRRAKVHNELLTLLGPVRRRAFGPPPAEERFPTVVMIHFRFVSFFGPASRKVIFAKHN